MLNRLQYSINFWMVMLSGIINRNDFNRFIDIQKQRNECLFTQIKHNNITKIIVLIDLHIWISTKIKNSISNSYFWFSLTNLETTDNTKLYSFLRAWICNAHHTKTKIHTGIHFFTWKYELWKNCHRQISNTNIVSITFNNLKNSYKIRFIISNLLQRLNKDKNSPSEIIIVCNKVIKDIKNANKIFYFQQQWYHFNLCLKRS